MVEAGLNKQLIDAGAKLVQSLDEKGLSPAAAFWLYSSDAQSWRLFMVDSKLGKSGPKGAYRRIQKAMKELSEESRPLTLSDISLLESDAPFVQKLRTAVKTGPGISGIRFTHDAVNGNLIENAYIYRIT